MRFGDASGRTRVSWILRRLNYHPILALSVKNLKKPKKGAKVTEATWSGASVAEARFFETGEF